MNTKRMLAVMLAVLMTLGVFSAVPAPALGKSVVFAAETPEKAPETETCAVLYETPEEYDEHDYQLAVAFMEQTCQDGMKNGEKLAWLYGFSYDPEDPGAWGATQYYDENGVPHGYGIIWSNEAVRHLAAIDIWFEGDFGDEVAKPSGELLLSGCASLLSVAFWDTEISRADVSGCSALKYFSSGDKALASVDLTGCSSLIELLVSCEHITELDFPDSHLLKNVQCIGTLVTSLDVTGCPELRILRAIANEIEELDVSCCPLLERLECQNNRITSLDVRDHHMLTDLYCSDNGMTNLDISGCEALTEFLCFNNNLKEIDASCSPLVWFDRASASGSGCVGCFSGIYYFGPERLIAYPDEGAEFLGWYSLAGTLVSAETELLKSATNYTSVVARFTGGEVAEHPTPEGYNEHDYQNMLAFLETADENGVKNGDKLAALYYGSYDPDDPQSWGQALCTDYRELVGGTGVVWNNEPEKRIFHIDWNIGENPFITDVSEPVGYIDVSDFEALQYLGCFNNPGITGIDVHGCHTLYQVVCPNSGVAFLDTSDCPVLFYIDCDSCALSELDVSDNPALRYLYCADNALTELDVSNNAELVELKVQHNALTELDVDDHRSLELLNCSYNALTSIQIRSCTELITVDCSYNALESFRADVCPALEDVDLRGNRLHDLTFTACQRMFFRSVEVWYSEPGSFEFHTERLPDPDTGGTRRAEYLTASADEGGVFLGWYADYINNEELITLNTVLCSLDTDIDMVEGRFAAAGAPYDYYTDEFLCMRDFLETADENGVKNGDKLLPYYNPADPESWCFTDDNGSLYGVEWSNSYTDKYCVKAFVCGGCELVGELDLSSCRHLMTVSCEDNLITSLKLTRTDWLQFVDCTGNPLTYIEFPPGSGLPVDTLNSVGSGFVSARYSAEENSFVVFAEPAQDAEFLGWFDENGALASEEAVFDIGDRSFIRLTARFTPTAASGDANSDGQVNAQDALLILRYSLGISELPCDDAVCDMNGDGYVNAQDALIVLRVALGLV